MSKVSDLLGKTLTAVDGKVGGDEVVLTLADGKKFKFYHDQDCCERVRVEDIVGDLNDLVGSPLTLAEESTSKEDKPEGVGGLPVLHDSHTWTFYRFATAKGYVTIRWLGESNGYYSEAVSFSPV